jgi:hypothetical protein
MEAADRKQASLAGLKLDHPNFSGSNANVSDGEINASNGREKGLNGIRLKP